jgi:hypothetical protein
MFIGVILVVLVVVAAVVGVATWGKRGGPAAAPAGRAGKGDDEYDTGVRTPRHISLLTEAIGYIGTILVVAGVASAVGEQWPDLGRPVRLAVLAAGTAIFLALGLATRSSAEPAFRRLASVAFAVSVAGFAGGAAVVNQFYETDGKTVFVTVATASTAYAAVLWWAHRYAIQHGVLFLGVMLSAASIFVSTIHNPQVWIVCLTLWAIAVAWTALGWARRIPPWWVAVPLGLLVVLVAPAYLPNEAARFALGIGTAVVVMGLSVAVKFIPALGFSAVAMLGYVIGAVTYYFRDTLGVPAALAIAGFVILTIAVVVARLLPFMTRKPPQEGPPSAAEPPSAAGAPGAPGAPGAGPESRRAA